MAVRSSSSVSAGVCRLWASDSLKADLQGSRKVYYRGDPHIVSSLSTPKKQVEQVN